MPVDQNHPLLSRGRIQLTISIFLSIMRKYIGTDRRSIPDFCAYFFALAMKDPSKNDELLIDEEDRYYPFYLHREKSSAYKMFSGAQNIPISVATKVYGNLDKTSLLEEITGLSFDTRKNLCGELQSNGIDCTPDNVDEVCAEVLSDLLKERLGLEKDRRIPPLEHRNEVGERIPTVPLTPVPYANGVVYVDGKPILLTLMPVSDEERSSNDLPYIDALCEVYTEKLQTAISKDNLEGLPDKMKHHLTNQRKAYYGIEGVRRQIRDAFGDAEDQIDALKDDAYEGIEMVYHSDRYVGGYERLQAVLEKITSTTLSRSTLMNIQGLIGNLEKKGLCHMLVNDKRIASWVTPDA